MRRRLLNFSKVSSIVIWYDSFSGELTFENFCLNFYRKTASDAACERINILEKSA